MNIALVPPTYDKYQNEAVNITTFLLAKELNNLGHNAVIICRRKARGKNSKPQKKFEIIEGVRIYRPFKCKYKILFRFQSYVTLLVRSVKYISKKENIKFDIIQTMSAAPILGIRSRLLKINFPNSKKNA